MTSSCSSEGAVRPLALHPPSPVHRALSIAEIMSTSTKHKMYMCVKSSHIVRVIHLPSKGHIRSFAFHLPTPASVHPAHCMLQTPSLRELLVAGAPRAAGGIRPPDLQRPFTLLLSMEVPDSGCLIQASHGTLILSYVRAEELT